MTTTKDEIMKEFEQLDNGFMKQRHITFLSTSLDSYLDSYKSQLRERIEGMIKADDTPEWKSITLNDFLSII